MVVTAGGLDRARLLPSPAPGVQLWSLDLRPGPDDGGHAGLSGEDRARWAQLRPGDAARLLARRALLRGLVARRAGRAVEEVRLPVDDGPRRAELPDGGGWYVSTSSSGARGLVALADVPVGVDLEELPGPPDAVLVGRELLPPAEADWVARGGAAAPERFLRLWVRKEAVVKCTGEGLSRDLRSFTVAPAEPRAVVPALPGSGMGPVTVLDVSAPGCLAALACGVPLVPATGPVGPAPAATVLR